MKTNTIEYYMDIFHPLFRIDIGDKIAVTNNDEIIVYPKSIFQGFHRWFHMVNRFECKDQLLNLIEKYELFTRLQHDDSILSMIQYMNSKLSKALFCLGETYRNDLQLSTCFFNLASSFI